MYMYFLDVQNLHSIVHVHVHVHSTCEQIFFQPSVLVCYIYMYMYMHLSSDYSLLRAVGELKGIFNPLQQLMGKLTDVLLSSCVLVALGKGLLQ